ncbi:MAG: uncharacterized protein KVP18_004480 [Porospora cf. gigantea A]|uniref:uncharacterized protein n=1 Tax=Porospora cf. gigantea A TaxID=2853593 RepID=UPI00355943E5|nr:MAG: hypothetical protein KVP18_004480 [Porospora cf. gigantea A]
METPLPPLVSILKLTQARENDVQQLLKDLKQTKPNARQFQRVPKQLRRRAASHNPFRVPQRLRGNLMNEFLVAPPKEGRRQKRKRRVMDLALEYAGRSSQTRWLETHLWHAKRFHMEKFWGHHLATRQCEKSRRKAYRFSKHKCLVHDRSYLELIEISGNGSLQVLNRILRSPLDGVPPDVISGSRRMKVELYCDEPLGDAYLLGLAGSLCLWVHPAALPNISQALLTAVQLYDQDSLDLLHGLPPTKARQINSVSCFEIRGRNALRVLQNCVSLATGCNATEAGKIWQEATRFHHQPLPFPSHVCWPLSIKVPTVLGPRPPRSNTVRSIRPEVPLDLPAWVTGWPSMEPDASFLTTCQAARVAHPRKVTTRSRKRRNMRTVLDRLRKRRAELQQSAEGLRHEGSPPKPASHTDKAMPLLVFPVRSSSAGVCLDGFDVLLPSAWSSVLWTLLTRRQTVPLGVYERERVLYEAGQLSFPLRNLASIGWEEHRRRAVAVLSRHRRMPPSRRPNYLLLRSPTPFMPLFPVLDDATLVSMDALQRGVPSDGALVFPMERSELEALFRRHPPYRVTSQVSSSDHFFRRWSMPKMKLTERPRGVHLQDFRHELEPDRRFATKAAKTVPFHNEVFNPLLDTDMLETAQFRLADLPWRAAGGVLMGGHSLARARGFALGYVSDSCLTRSYNQMCDVLKDLFGMRPYTQEVMAPFWFKPSSSLVLNVAFVRLLVSSSLVQ